MTFSRVPREASVGNLQTLYEFVQDTLKPVDSGETPWKYPVLLVDNLSVLLSLGLGAVAVLDFMQYCRATVCCKWKVSRGCRCCSAWSLRTQTCVLCLLCLFALRLAFLWQTQKFFVPPILLYPTWHC